MLDGCVEDVLMLNDYDNVAPPFVIRWSLSSSILQDVTSGSATVLITWSAGVITFWRFVQIPSFVELKSSESSW